MNTVTSERYQRASNAVAAGQTQVDGSIIDTAGYESVKFIYSFGTITTGAVTSVKASMGNQSGGGDLTDIAGSSITVADDDDNQIVVLEIVKPQKRYVRPIIVRGTQNAVVDGIVAVLTRAHKQPTTDDTSTVVGRKTLVSPANGTA